MLVVKERQTLKKLPKKKVSFQRQATLHQPVTRQKYWWSNIKLNISQCWVKSIDECFTGFLFKFVLVPVLRTGLYKVAQEYIFWYRFLGIWKYPTTKLTNKYCICWHLTDNCLQFCSKFTKKIPHTGDTESLNWCG